MTRLFLPIFMVVVIYDISALWPLLFTSYLPLLIVAYVVVHSIFAVVPCGICASVLLKCTVVL